MGTSPRKNGDAEGGVAVEYGPVKALHANADRADRHRQPGRPETERVPGRRSGVHHGLELAVPNPAFS